MLSLGSNPIDCGYLEAAKSNLNAPDSTTFYQNIPLKYSYGKVSKKEFKKHYDSSYWGIRKVTWIIAVPFRLLGAIIALAGALICLPRKDKTAAKKHFFIARRLCQYALGDLICIFNDKSGQHKISEARTHIKLYEIASLPLDQRSAAYKFYFQDSAEILAEHTSEMDNKLRTVAPWMNQFVFQERADS